jgi:hypothetical protein
MIGQFAFRYCADMPEVERAEGSRLRELRRFRGCSVVSLVVPGSVEVVDGFGSCVRLSRVAFEILNLLREVGGGANFPIREIETPDSVQVLSGLEDTSEMTRIIVG